jgi:hypothetical protein
LKKHDISDWLGCGSCYGRKVGSCVLVVSRFFLFIILICFSIFYLLHFVLYTQDKLNKAKGALRNLLLVAIVGLCECLNDLAYVRVVMVYTSSKVTSTVEVLFGLWKEAR